MSDASDDLSVEPAAAQAPARRKRVSSQDVAKASGVSRATVSYVLNDTKGHSISEKTRELVLRTARELGHVPYAPARSLRLGRSSIVLALVSDFSLGYVSNELLRRLDAALVGRGYILMVHRFDESVRTISDMWRLVSPSVVVSMGGISLNAEPILAEPEIDDDTGPSLVRLQTLLPHVEAGRIQAEYLLDNGRRRLGYANFTAASVAPVAEGRLGGFRELCDEREAAAPIVCAVDPDEPDTVAAAVDTWLSGTPVDAIAAHNDVIALEIVAELHSRGVAVGSDVAVMGVDNIPSARAGLTTIEIDIEALSSAMIASVFAAIEHEPEPPVEDGFYHLIVRSTA